MSIKNKEIESQEVALKYEHDARTIESGNIFDRLELIRKSSEKWRERLGMFYATCLISGFLRYNVMSQLSL